MTLIMKGMKMPTFEEIRLMLGLAFVIGCPMIFLLM